jgi:hypothetical protein
VAGSTLRKIDFSNNNGARFDADYKVNLIELKCDSNNLTILHLVNGNNSILNRISTLGNDSLICISVDNHIYSTINWIGSQFQFDNYTGFNTNYCNSSYSVCQAKFGKIQPAIGQVTLLDSTIGNNLRYTWYFGNGDSSVSMLPTHNYASSGTYKVCLSIFDTLGGCYDYFCDSITVDTSGVLRNSWTLRVVRNIVGVEDLSGKDIENLNIYPNPTTEVLNIEFENDGNYSLFSIDGKQVLQNGKLQNELTSIDISDLRTGMYLLRVVTDGGNVITKRVIKK